MSARSRARLVVVLLGGCSAVEVSVGAWEPDAGTPDAVLEAGSTDDGAAPEPAPRTGDARCPPRTFVGYCKRFLFGSWSQMSAHRLFG